MTKRAGRPETGRAGTTRQVDPQLVHFMRSVATGQTDETLTEQFGLSYNTWRKLVTGLPIRASLADRIEDRIGQMRDVIELSA